MSNAPGSPQPVALSALVINPKATLNPASLNFRTIQSMTSSTLNVTLSDSGGTPLNLSSVRVTGGNSIYFTQTNNCGSTVSASGSCTIAVTFKPAMAGTFGASLTIVDNAKSGDGTQTILLFGGGK